MMTRISKATDILILSRVAQDLEPSLRTVHLKVGLAAILGGLLSLAVCGQFGIGWTSFAEALSAKVHASMDPIACSLTCGGLFAVFPAMLLRLLCAPMQFRTIVRRRFGALVLWIGGFGGVLVYHGHHGNEAPQFAAWILAALIALIGLSFFFDRIVPTLDLGLLRFVRIRN